MMSKELLILLQRRSSCNHSYLLMRKTSLWQFITKFQKKKSTKYRPSYRHQSLSGPWQISPCYWVLTRQKRRMKKNRYWKKSWSNLTSTCLQQFIFHLLIRVQETMLCFMYLPMNLVFFRLRKEPLTWSASNFTDQKKYLSTQKRIKSSKFGLKKLRETLHWCLL